MIETQHQRAHLPRRHATSRAANMPPTSAHQDASSFRRQGTRCRTANRSGSCVVSYHHTMVNMVVVALMSLIMLSAQRTAAFAPQPLARASFAPSSSSLSMATWSDSRAVREYQEFLASGQQEIVMTPDGASVIVRPVADEQCELAAALFQIGGGNDVVITPGQDLPASDGSYPIYITIPPTQLQEFLTSLPDSYRERREDFVFFSGGLAYGNVEKILKDYGYCRDTMTQVLISGAKLSPRIEDISVNLGNDAQGEVKRAGECAACGKWQGSIAQRLEQQNVICKTGFYREWRRLMVSLLYDLNTFISTVLIHLC